MVRAIRKGVYYAMEMTMTDRINSVNVEDQAAVFEVAAKASHTASLPTKPADLQLKKPIKLIVSDVDGTLVDTHKHVSDETVAAVKAAIEAGVTVAVASGRAWGEMGEVIHRIPEIQHYICSNGAVVFEQQGGDTTTVFHQSFSNAEGLRLLDELRPFDVYIEAYGGKDIYGETEGMLEFASNLPPHLVPLMKASRTMVPNLREHIVKTGMDLEKIQLFYGTEAKKEAILDHFKGDHRFVIIQSSEGNLEFVQPGISKGRAVAALADSLGLTADEVMTIGDSNNDLTMLAYGGISFAMMNGETTAKATAKFLAPTNDEQGVAQMIRLVLAAEEQQAI